MIELDDTRPLISLPTDLSGAGTGERLLPHQPRHLDDPGQCMVVLAGTVDLFLSEVSDRGQAGPREHLARFIAGDVLFGVAPAEPLADTMLLAVGDEHAVIAPLPLSELTGRSDHAAVAAAVDRWITALTHAMTVLITPRPSVLRLITPGRQLDLDRPGRFGLAHGQGPVAWCRFSTTTLLYLDSETLPDSADSGAPQSPFPLPCFPLTGDAWVGLISRSQVTALTTRDALAQGLLWGGLQAFHQVLMQALPLNMRLMAVDEINRLRERERINEQALIRANQALRATLTGGDGTGRFTDTNQQDLAAGGTLAEARRRAVRRLSDLLDLGWVPPRHRFGRSDPLEVPTLEDIARSQGLRLREVRLDGDWWHHDNGPLLIEQGNGNAPTVVWTEPNRLLATSRLHRYDASLDQITSLSAHELRSLGKMPDVRVRMAYAALPDAVSGPGGLLAPIWKRHSADLAGLGLFSVVSGLCGMALPLATYHIVATDIPDHDRPILGAIAIVLTVLALLYFVLRLSARLAALRLEGHVANLTQTALMDRLLRLPPGFFRNTAAGDLATRLLSTRQLCDGLSGPLVKALAAGSLGLGAFIVMSAMSWQLALVAPLTSLGLGLGLALATRRLLRLERRAASLSASLSGLMLELVEGAAKLRLAAAEDRAYHRWASLFAPLRVARLAAARLRTGLGAIMAGLGSGALAGIIGYGMLDPEVIPDAASLSAFLIAFSIWMGALTTGAGAWLEMLALQPGLDQIRPLLEARPENNETRADPGPLSGAVELSRVTFRYNADGPGVLHDISLSVAAGECIAIVGPSASGKSTLSRLLLGFETPVSGAVLYDGMDLAHLDPGALRRQCGIVPQNGRLMPGTLLANILGARPYLAESDAWNAAQSVGLADDIVAMPMGMHTVITSSNTLSGGQVQRVLLARAVVGNPRLILLDEATSALDNRSQALVTSTLDRMNATRIIIAHRLSTVERADRVYVLVDGRIVETGKPADLLAADGVYARLARRQMLQSQS